MDSSVEGHELDPLPDGDAGTEGKYVLLVPTASELDGLSYLDPGQRPVLDSRIVRLSGSGLRLGATASEYQKGNQWETASTHQRLSRKKRSTANPARSR